MRCRGLTILELLIAITVLMVALIGLISLMYYTTRLNAANRENLTALRAAEKQVETMRAVKFSEIFARYNGTTSDDLSPVPNPGETFDVEGLKPMPAQKCGRIVFPGDGVRLLENVQDAAWGMPRDLNGNKAIDADNVAGPDLKLLPVRVEITWTGIQGKRTLTYHHLFLKTEGGP